MPYTHKSSTPWDGSMEHESVRNSPAKHFFSTLPAYVQESIMQSGVDFSSEHDLRSFVDNLGQHGTERNFNDNGGME